MQRRLTLVVRTGDAVEEYVERAGDAMWDALRRRPLLGVALIGSVGLVAASLVGVPEGRIGLRRIPRPAQGPVALGGDSGNDADSPPQVVRSASHHHQHHHLRETGLDGPRHPVTDKCLLSLRTPTEK
jgi:hypothetical protein